MDSILKISLIQANLHWKTVDANLAMFEEKLWELGQGSDLYVLPEMFNTAFAIDRDLAETMNGRTHRWMQQMASQLKGAVCGSLMIKEGGHVVNRFLLVEPSGTIQMYDKRHLWIGPEADLLSASNQRVIWQLKGWRIFPMICYDLRFPVWTRQATKELEYDLIINAASWPTKRVIAWKRMLPSRAVENLAYCVGVNRTGIDSEGVPYPGASGIWSFDGNTMAELGEKPGTLTVDLSRDDLSVYREQLPFYLNADQFKIQ